MGCRRDSVRDYVWDAEETWPLAQETQGSGTEKRFVIYYKLFF